MPNLRARIDRPEWMDTVTFEPPVIRRTLDFLALTARHFGGTRIVTDILSSWCGRWPKDRPVTILDVGTGGANVPVAIARWARRSGQRVRVVALDLVPEIAAAARARAAAFPEIEVRCADVFRLRDEGGVFDYVTASLFLHHVPSARIEEVLTLFDSLTTRGLLLSDLSRSVASYWSVTALAMLAGNRVVRHDAPLSVRRSFTPAELDAFARRAGLLYLRAAPAAWFRLTLAGEKT